VSAIELVLRSMIRISDEELHLFLAQTLPRRVRQNELVSRPGEISEEVYFVNQGLLRVILIGSEGQEYTVHFALENQFIANYSSFLLRQPSLYALQALEATELIVLPRVAIEWGYERLQEGQKLGRMIAEYYFLYQDNRIWNQYARTPKERYDSISTVFPGIHNRVPQHMIASYLGITPVHLSRLKKASLVKQIS
jgi:CRP-like cAMP-binding protein